MADPSTLPDIPPIPEKGSYIPPVPAGLEDITALYARISYDRHDGAGVIRQLEDGLQLCRVRGLPNVFIFCDNSLSASKPNGRRPAMERILELTDAGRVRRFVAWKDDRLYRQQAEYIQLLVRLKDRPLAIIPVRGSELDLSTTHGRAIAMFLIGRAEDEAKAISERVKREMEQRRQKGLHTGGGRPFGWARIEREDGRSTWDIHQLDPHESKLVRDAVRDTIDGTPADAIAQRWNGSSGAPRPFGKSPWSSTSIRNILLNPRIAGLNAVNPEWRRHRGDTEYKEIIGKGDGWPEIVTRDEWERCRSVLLGRTALARSRRAAPRRSLLTGMIHCVSEEHRDEHGVLHPQPMMRASRESSGEHRYIYYRCVRSGGLGCGSVIKAGDPLNPNEDSRHAGVDDKVVLATWAEFDSADLDAVVKDDEHSRQTQDVLAAVRELEQRRAAVELEVTKGFPAASAARIIRDINAEIEQKEEELAQATSSVPVLARRFAGHPGALRDAWPDLTVDERRACIAFAVKGVQVKPTRTRPGQKNTDIDYRVEFGLPESVEAR